jgi:hypothetical protein
MLALSMAAIDFLLLKHRMKGGGVKFRKSVATHEVAIMNGLIGREIQCPYCGEMITVMLDCSVSSQEYIEDCQVCCRPINFVVSVLGDDDVNVVVNTDSD